jgi:hypothetical protein
MGKSVNPNVKELWLDRLENGDIPQTTNKLADLEGGRCCLGVLCDIAVEEGVINPPVVDDDRLMYDNEIAVLPPKVMEWSGLEHNNGGFALNPEEKPDYIDDALSYRNDTGKTFPEIAQIIRERF